MRILVVILIMALQAPSATFPSVAAADPFDATVRHDLIFAASRWTPPRRRSRRRGTRARPRRTGVGASLTPAAWTSGFFPGALWRIYEQTGGTLWLTRATDWQAGVEGQKNDTLSHDVGFKIFTSFGNGYRLTGTDAYRQVVLQGASSLASRYSSTVGAIKSWDGPTSSDFRVIIDNMMNLEILLWASKHGGQSAWYDMAVSHALKTMTNHVRADGSTYQGVNYNPSTGAVKAKFTHQGEAVESTWSRGQAWAVYGFTMVYRETGDSRFLDTARRVADYYIDHLPADHVPYWDFEASGIPNEPREQLGRRDRGIRSARTRRARDRRRPCDPIRAGREGHAGLPVVERVPRGGDDQRRDPAPRHAERTRWRLGHRADLRRLLLHRGAPPVPVAGGDDHRCRDRAPDRRSHRHVRRRLRTVQGRRAIPAGRDRGR